MPDKIKASGGGGDTPKSMWRDVGDEAMQISQVPPPPQEAGLMSKMGSWLGISKGDPNAPQQEEASEVPSKTRFTNGQRGEMKPDWQDLEPIAAVSTGAAGGGLAPAMRGVGGAMVRGAATTGGGYLAEHGLRGQMPSLKGAAIAAGTGMIGGPLLEYGGGSLLSKVLKRAGIGKVAGEAGAEVGETAASDIERRAADMPYEGPDKRLMSRKTGKPVYENLHAEHEARMKAAGLATPESQAAETGLWHAGHGGGIPNPSAITPENRRLIQKLMDSGLIPRN